MDCPDDKCISCQDSYFVEDDKCTKCDVACESTCTGAGPKKCTDNKCKDPGYFSDPAKPADGCKPCEDVLTNCLKCTSS